MSYFDKVYDDDFSDETDPTVSRETLIPSDVSRETSPLPPPLLTFRYKCDECGYVAHELTGPEIVLTHNYVYTYLVPMFAVACSSCHKNDTYAGHITTASERV
jgi:hypothetical protein